MILQVVLLLSVVTGGAASAVDEDDPAWSACWTSFEPPVCEAEDVHIPKVGCYYEETCNSSSWSLCSVNKPEFRHSFGVRGYAKGLAKLGFDQIPTLPDFVQVLDLSSILQFKLLNDIFANVPHITGLILKDAGMRYIAEESLIELKNLTCIDLDNNPQLGELDDGINVLQQLLLLPSLRRLSARHCNLFSAWKYSTNTKNTNLLSLWLSGNPMPGIVPMALFRNLTGLRQLDLSICRLEDSYGIFLMSGIGFMYLKELQMFNLSNNHLTQFSTDNKYSRYMYLINIRVLDVSHNDIKMLPSQLGPTAFPRLEHLNLSHNSISEFLPSSVLPASEFPTLRYLDLSSQNVPTVDVEATILQIPSLLSLNLENNRLRFKSLLVNMTNDAGFSKRNAKLRKLYVSGNALRQFNEQKLLDLLGHLHDLETLSLANSRLDFVSATVFSNFPKLRVLNLRDNAINVIPEGCFDPLTVLSRLDLSNNKITVISHRTFGEGLRARLDVVDLGQNPIVCSCDLLWFRDWFMADSKLFSVSDPDYQCHNTPAKTQLADFTMHQQACLLSREVNEGIIFICSFLTITSTAAVLLFRYRWHLRLLLYEVFRGRPAVREAYLRQNRFDYDLFVSYAHEDLAWVRGRLVPELEGRLGLRLCIHDTHFIPGKPILHNIVDSVEKSKKVLMVFSRDFARSRWCQFELTTCLEHVMDHEDSLIIVCADDVTSHHTMTSAMMAVLRTTTYLQWREGEDAVRAFWGRLGQALQEILHQDQQQYV